MLKFHFLRVKNVSVSLNLLVFINQMMVPTSEHLAIDTLHLLLHLPDDLRLTFAVRYGISNIPVAE